MAGVEAINPGGDEALKTEAEVNAQKIGLVLAKVDELRNEYFASESKKSVDLREVLKEGKKVYVVMTAGEEAGLEERLVIGRISPAKSLETARVQMVFMQTGQVVTKENFERLLQFFSVDPNDPARSVRLGNYAGVDYIVTERVSKMPGGTMKNKGILAGYIAEELEVLVKSIYCQRIISDRFHGESTQSLGAGKLAVEDKKLGKSYPCDFEIDLQKNPQGNKLLPTLEEILGRKLQNERIFALGISR